jgi:hypothetical protein
MRSRSPGPYKVRVAYKSPTSRLQVSTRYESPASRLRVAYKSPTSRLQVADSTLSWSGHSTTCQPMELVSLPTQYASDATLATSPTAVVESAAGATFAPGAPPLATYVD